MTIRLDDIFLCSIFHITVICVMANSLNSMLHIVIVQQVSVFLCSAWENKSNDIASHSNSDGIFRQMRMLDKFFKQMSWHL